MAYDLNWEILRPVDVAGSVTRGFQQGRAFRQQEDERQRRDQFTRSAFDAIDPTTGQINLPAMRSAFRGAQDVQGAMAFEETQRERAETRQEQARDAIAGIARDVLSVPYAERRAYLQSALPALQQFGVTPEQLAGFDPTDAALRTYASQGSQGTRPIVIDGVAMHPETGEPLFESPYDRIIPGSDNSFYRVPRIGIGRGGTVGPSPRGAVVQGEPPEILTDEEMMQPEGGAGQDGPRTFPQ